MTSAVRKLAPYARLMWTQIKGEPLEWNWHHEIVCDELEAMAWSETARDLAVCQPPRTLKSYLVSVALPSWIWLRRPHLSVMVVGNDEALVKAQGIEARDLILSPAYAEMKAIAHELYKVPDWSLHYAANETTKYSTTRGGTRWSLGMRSDMTGKGCDLQILDDLLDAKRVDGTERSAEICIEAWNIVQRTLSSRFNNKRKALRVCIGQRLHELDPPGQAIAAGWPAIVLPMRAEADRPDRHPRDLRAPGELLHPERHPEATVRTMEAELGDQAPGQLQQRPQPKGGGLLAVASWLWVDRSACPSSFTREACGWDLAIGASQGASNSAGYWGGLHDGRVYIGDSEVGQWEITGQIDAIRRLALRHPKAAAKYIEHRANARAAIDLLRKELPGLVPVEPDGDKVVRAQAWAPFLDAGNLVLPCRCGQTEPHRHGDANRLPGEPWAVELVQECAAFPKGARKDRVDALGYLVRPLLTRRGGLELSAA